MPTYDYRCTSCSHEFELFQSMRDPVKRKCPACGRAALERLIGTGAAILFKGSGFYETDYRSESYKKAADADKPAEAKASDAKAPDVKGADTKASDGTSSDTKKADGTKVGSASSGREGATKVKPDRAPKPAAAAKPRKAKASE